MILTVLMSTYNGEKYLREQIDSILMQELPSDHQLKLYVRDDGSQDKTTDILDEYQKQGHLKWYSGENLGPAKSFWNLIETSEKSDFYALSDQDDVWCEGKLHRALEKLSKMNADKDAPLLYASEVTPVDNELNPIQIKEKDKRMSYCDYAHSLIYSKAPGCTFVFNESARKKLLLFDTESGFIDMHDWMIHKIVLIFGEMYMDSSATMLYRQHGANVVGAVSNGVRNYIRRIANFFSKTKNVRSNVAKALLDVYGSNMSEDKKNVTKLLAEYRGSLNSKLKLIREKSFKVHSVNDLFFAILVFMGKV